MNTKKSLFCLPLGFNTTHIMPFAVLLNKCGFVIYGNRTFLDAVGRLNNCLTVFMPESEQIENVGICIGDCLDEACVAKIKPYHDADVLTVHADLLESAPALFEYFLLLLATNDTEMVVERTASELALQPPIKVIDLLTPVRLALNEYAGTLLNAAPVLKRFENDLGVASKHFDVSLSTASNRADLMTHFMVQLERMNPKNPVRRLLQEWKEDLEAGDNGS